MEIVFFDCEVVSWCVTFNLEERLNIIVLLCSIFHKLFAEFKYEKIFFSSHCIIMLVNDFIPTCSQIDMCTTSE